MRSSASARGPCLPGSRVRAGARACRGAVSGRCRGLPGGRPSAPDREPISAPDRERIPVPDGRPISAPAQEPIPAPGFTYVAGLTTRFTNKLPTFWNDRVHILSDIETDGQ